MIYCTDSPYLVSHLSSLDTEVIKESLCLIACLQNAKSPVVESCARSHLEAENATNIQILLYDLLLRFGLQLLWSVLAVRMRTAPPYSFFVTSNSFRDNKCYWEISSVANYTYLNHKHAHVMNGHMRKVWRLPPNLTIRNEWMHDESNIWAITVAIMKATIQSTITDQSRLLSSFAT